VGSRLRGDDIAGLHAAETLKAALKTARRTREGLSPFPAVRKRGLSLSGERGQSPSRRSARRGQPPSVRRVKIFLGETAPENLTGEIKRFRPSHLVVIDAAEAGHKPGHLSLIEVSAIGSGGALSTHNLPISVLTDYLQKDTGCQVLVLGIQPASIHFGAEPTAAVLAAAERLAAALAAALS
jgi:hydrogenase 3 maturation protease